MKRNWLQNSPVVLRPSSSTRQIILWAKYLPRKSWNSSEICVSNGTSCVSWMRFTSGLSTNLTTTSEWVSLFNARNKKLISACTRIVNYIFESILASLPQMWDRTITICSAGKTFSVTGWKLGWAYGPAHLLRNLFVAHQNALYTCVTPTQVNSILWIEDQLKAGKKRVPVSLTLIGSRSSWTRNRTRKAEYRWKLFQITWEASRIKARLHGEIFGNEKKRLFWIVLFQFS